MSLSEREKGKIHEKLVAEKLQRLLKQEYGREYYVCKLVREKTPGFPDLIFVNKKNKRAELLVEVKTENRALLPKQKKKIKDLERQGFAIWVCRVKPREERFLIEDKNGNPLGSVGY